MTGGSIFNKLGAHPHNNPPTYTRRGCAFIINNLKHFFIMDNNNGNNNELNGLVLMHCIKQSVMYADALEKYENGYNPRTNVWELLTVAETHGCDPVAEIVATILAAAGAGALTEPVAALCDLIIALKWKTKFFDPTRDPRNVPIKLLNEVYNSALDVTNAALHEGKIPSDVVEKVEEFIYA